MLNRPSQTDGQRIVFHRSKTDGFSFSGVVFGAVERGRDLFADNRLNLPADFFAGQFADTGAAGPDGLQIL